MEKKASKMEAFMGEVDYNRGGEGRNFLLLFAILFTLWEAVIGKAWRISRPIFFLLSKKVHDGYWLVLLSPAVFLTWVAGAVVVAILYATPVALAFILAPISLAVAVLLELPSDFINSKKKREDISTSGKMDTALVASSAFILVAAIVTLLVLSCY